MKFHNLFNEIKRHTAIYFTCKYIFGKGKIGKCRQVQLTSFVIPSNQVKNTNYGKQEKQKTGSGQTINYRAKLMAEDETYYMLYKLWYLHATIINLHGHVLRYHSHKLQLALPFRYFLQVQRCYEVASTAVPEIKNCIFSKVGLSEPETTIPP